MLAPRDRAILEHQLAQANVESERQRTQAEADFKSLKDKSTRDLDAIKADLKMQKVSSKSVEVRNKDLASQLEKLTSESSARDKENERLLADALRLARTLKDSAEKLLEAIRSSSLASSLSLQFLNNQETGQPSTTSSTSSLEIPIPASSLAIRKELDIIARFDIRSFEEVILKSFKLVKKWQQKATECVPPACRGTPYWDDLTDFRLVFPLEVPRQGQGQDRDWTLLLKRPCPLPPDAQLHRSCPTLGGVQRQLPALLP